MAQTFPDFLRDRIAAALYQTSHAANLPSGFIPGASPTADPKFGDYQSNAAMILAKELRTNPRAFAMELVSKLDVAEWFETPEIAGPGFINFKLKPEAVATRVLELAKDERLGVPKVEQPKTIVIDFSAPNVAKPMHVGHIRSTIIGDCLARVARFAGHKVITDNHIGDWGTQFGMVIFGWKHLLNESALEADPIRELLRIYKAVNNRIKLEETRQELAGFVGSEEMRQKLEATLAALEKGALLMPENAVLENLTRETNLITQCRLELVKLQGGDEENLSIWKRCVKVSLDGLAKIYAQLDVHFDHYLGESYFNDALAPLVEELIAKNIARESEGAICVFSDGSKPLEEDPFKIFNEVWVDQPCMIRKNDGGFNYATTDLATVDYRVKEWNADECWYVVGTPQQLHFRQVIEIAKRRGHTVKLIHVAFGSILGVDGKPFRTRSGENVGLQEVLSESIERALEFLNAREQEDEKFVLPANEKEQVAKVIGLGAVKYAELSQARLTDYKFDWDRMLSLKGNTAPYLINSYVRTRGIFRKLDGGFTPPSQLEITEAGESALAIKLLQFGEAITSVLEDQRPNLLANYIYDLAKAYHAFYEACPVLKAEGNVRESRLLLCDATSRVLRRGLSLLGIEVTERM